MQYKKGDLSNLNQFYSITLKKQGSVFIKQHIKAVPLSVVPGHAAQMSPIKRFAEGQHVTAALRSCQHAKQGP